MDLRIATIIGAALLGFGSGGAHAQDTYAPGSVQYEFGQILVDAAPMPRDPNVAGQVPVALTIKGGVSLGNYEAGVNWALLRFLKDLLRVQDLPTPVLLAAAGASAGAINGVLSGVYWCLEDSVSDTLENNMIREAWREVDIAGLLDHHVDPGKPPNPENNGVFSRAAVAKVQTRVVDIMNTGRFRPDCQVAFGFSLTRADPVRVDRAGMDLPNQRLLVPLKFAVDGAGKLTVLNLDDAGASDGVYRASAVFLDNRLADDSATSGIRSETLFRAIKASSSFPVAFAPMKLDYCLRTRLTGYTQRGTDNRCPPDYRRLTSYFVDGGVFDNDPLGLVRRLAEYGERGKPFMRGQIRYINIDPGRRRPPRTYSKLSVASFSEPGDSMEIELIAGDGLIEDGTALQDINVQIVHFQQCRDSVVLADASIDLYETGNRTRRFLGALHTERGSSRGDLRGGPVIATEPGDELRFFVRAAPPDACLGMADASSFVVAAEPQGLSTQIGFLSGAIEAGRTALLFQEIVGERWRDGLDTTGSVRDRPLFQTARLTPLVGDYLFAFAGFFDRRFRDYDYFAGIYDATFGMAQTLCLDSDAVPACLADKFEEVYLSICSRGAGNPLARCRDAAPVANSALLTLLRLDICGPDDSMKGKDCAALESWQWAKDLQTTPSGTDAASIRALAAVARATIGAEIETRVSGQDPFVKFIRSLADDPGFVAAAGTPLERMLRKSDRPVPTWFYPVASTAIEQLLPLERLDQEIRSGVDLEPNALSSTALSALAVGGLAVETLMADKTGWRWHQTSVPDTAGLPVPVGLLPNELALDMDNGGAALYWSAGWRSATEPWGIDLRLSPYVRQMDGGNNIEFAEIQTYFTWSLNRVLPSVVGIGPSFSRNYSSPLIAKRDNFGFSIYAGLLGDKLRFTYGKRGFGSGEFEGSKAYLQLGVRDLPGLIYWISQSR